MAFDRQGTGLAILRILIGVFFLFQGVAKVRWFTDTSIVAGQLADWSHSVAPGSLSSQYLQRVAIPFANIFARVVPLAEICSGLALIIGVWTPFFGLVGFLMVLNAALASGELFKYSFLTSGYGLPVMAATLALTIGGVRLPLSVRR